MGSPAARVGDPTAHGGTLAGPGVPTVLIGGMPAAALGDQHICPMATPGSPPIPHVGGPVIRGSSGVFIGGRPAARLGDGAVCVGPPSAIVAGCPTVLIGETGAGSPLGSAAAAARAKVASPGSVRALSALSLAAGKGSASASHAIDVALTDRAGRPLAGVPLLLRDPRGEAIPGMSNAEGRFTAPGQEAEGRFTVVVPRLHDARWSASPERDRAVELSVAADGFEEGDPVGFEIIATSAEGRRIALEGVAGKVAGGRAAAAWTYSLRHETLLESAGIRSAELAFIAAAQHAIALGPPVRPIAPHSATEEKPPQVVVSATGVQVGLFFDGTGNDKERDQPLGRETNVAKLYGLYQENLIDGVRFDRVYVRGVGVEHGDWMGGFGGKGFSQRINEGLSNLRRILAHCPDQPVHLDVFGFSRGASEARHFVNALFLGEVQQHIGLAPERLDIRFLGLFDTVGAIGIPWWDFSFDTDLETGSGVRRLPTDFTVRRSRVRRVVHLIAETEVRSAFDLQSIREPPGAQAEIAHWLGIGGYRELVRRCPPLPEGWEEVVFPGAHSDVGGGYPPEEWVPDFAVPDHEPGESLISYYTRFADGEIALGGESLGIVGPSQWTRAQVETQIEAACRERVRQFRQGDAEERSGHHVQRGRPGLFSCPRCAHGGPGTFESPLQCPKHQGREDARPCPTRRRDNLLARVPLWYMIDKAREAGVALKDLSKTDMEVQEVIAVPTNHPLVSLCDARHQRKTFEAMARPGNHYFHRHVLTRIHDSRWMFDSSQTQREVYFKGRRD